MQRISRKIFCPIDCKYRSLLKGQLPHFLSLPDFLMVTCTKILPSLFKIFHIISLMITISNISTKMYLSNEAHKAKGAFIKDVKSWFKVHFVNRNLYGLYYGQFWRYLWLRLWLRWQLATWQSIHLGSVIF
jgi:hypothetical protein